MGAVLIFYVLFSVQKLRAVIMAHIVFLQTSGTAAAEKLRRRAQENNQSISDYVESLMQ